MSMPSSETSVNSVNDAESTSAALRRVEQERDAAWKFLAVRTSQIDAADAEIGQLDAQLDLARAELASARKELDAVRTARDNLGRDLAEARATIRALTRTEGSR